MTPTKVAEEIEKYLVAYHVVTTKRGVRQQEAADSIRSACTKLVTSFIDRIDDSVGDETTTRRAALVIDDEED